MAEVSVQQFPLGLHLTNAIEAIKGQVDSSHKVRNWDRDLWYNRFEGKNPHDLVDEYVGSGAKESHLNALVEGINNSFPGKAEDRPGFVNDVLKSIEQKLNPTD